MPELHEMADDLREAAQLSCDELGEYWTSLANLYPGAIDGSEEFAEAFKKELASEWQRFQDDFEIKETTEMREVTYRDLVYKYE